jgi:ER-bound oxygenase mpaB/B'/Rubber oxygenase, catalytic domain
MTFTPWTDAMLEPTRLLGDPLADAAVRTLYEDAGAGRAGLKAMNDFLFGLTFEGAFTHAKLPGPVHEFAVRTADPPPWADQKLVDAGQKFFYENGLGATVLLVCASLPECYVMKNGIHVLGLTTYIKDRPGLRILETSQMVRDAMLPGGLAPGAKGILAVQKVRRLHAAVRHLILTTATGGAGHDMGKVWGEARWDTAWGHPICQEDMAYTLQTFAYVVLRGLRTMGAEVTPAEEDAFIHCWNVVGYVLGVDRGLIPEPEPGDGGPSRFARAEMLYHAIRTRQAGKTDDGVAITRALVEFVEKLLGDRVPRKLPLKHLRDKDLARLPRLVMRDILGKDTMALLGVSLSSKPGLAGLAEQVGLVVARFIYDVLQRLSGGAFLGRASDSLHIVLTEELSKLPAGYKQTFLPESLRRTGPGAPPDPVDA